MAPDMTGRRARAGAPLSVGDLVRVVRGTERPPDGMTLMEGNGIVIAYRHDPQASARARPSAGRSSTPDFPRLKQETLFHGETFVVRSVSAPLPDRPRARDLCLVYCSERDCELYVARHELEVVEQAPKGE